MLECSRESIYELEDCEIKEIVKKFENVENKDTLKNIN